MDRGAIKTHNMFYVTTLTSVSFWVELKIWISNSYLIHVQTP